MTTDKKANQEKGKAGKAGKWQGTGFQPKPQDKKHVSLLDILLGRK
jgi:hypothetical protein